MKELKILLEAGYPLISVTTFEEERFLNELFAVAEKQGKSLWLWNEASGVRRVVKNAQLGILTYSAPMEDIPAFVPAVMDWFMNPDRRESGVLVLCDLHRLYDQSVAVRSVRNALECRGGEYTRTVLLLSPSQDIPLELKRQIVQIEYKLPDQATIESGFAEYRSKIPQEEFEAVVNACKGLTLLEMENALAYSVYSTGIDPKLIMEEKREIIRSSKSLEFYDPKDLKLGDVGGLELLKGWLGTRRKAFTQKARDYGLPTPRGCLLVGFPGSGKSLVAKTIAADWGFPLLRFDIGAAFQKYLGESEAEMRNARATAEAIAPCVLWVDEIEKTLSMGGDSESTGGVGSRMLADLLTWMQEKTAPVVILATANSIEGLSSALLRRGRFDEIFFVDLPGPRALREIYKIHLKKRGRDPKKFNLDEVIESAIGLSGAEVEAAIQDAMFSAFSGDREVTEGDLLMATREVIPYAVLQEAEANRLRKWATFHAKPASLEEVDLHKVQALRKSWGKPLPESQLSTAARRVLRPH